MSRLLFILFILAMVCIKLCVGKTDENTVEAPVYYTEDTYKPKNRDSLTDSARYADNSMPTGHAPYSNTRLDGNNNSKITLKNDTTAHSDAVAIVKQAGKIVRNTYIAAGDTAAIYIPNGTYTLYIYRGNGWHSAKKMPYNYNGGFVAKECFYSYAPISLSYCTHDVDISDAAGKRTCSADEVFCSSH